MATINPKPDFPKISLVTPSFQQVRFLEACIRSVLDQEYPNLEYFVIDGGSNDGSVEIIRKYADRLSDWRSHADNGHMDAVQEGFKRSGGEIMGWLNSDDRLAPWALEVVAAVFRQFPEVQWTTSMYPMVMNADGLVLAARRAEGIPFGSLLPRAQRAVQPALLFVHDPTGIHFLAPRVVGAGRRAGRYWIARGRRF